MEMNIITLTKDNLEQEHICCAISSNKDCQVAAKKAWSPIQADGYMFINCLWVSGQFKGKGYSSLLLDECIKDSKEKGKLGLAILSAKKKMPFLADPNYLRYKGFQVADTAEPYFEFMYLPFGTDPSIPKFKETVKKPDVEKEA
jgi:N-acetylglutamate synthase-like GNAT family acetyltransferase